MRSDRITIRKAAIACMAIQLLLVLAVGAPSSAAAERRGATPPSTDSLLLPEGSRFICEMHDVGSSGWVYCWEYLEGGSVGRHVRLGPDGDVSLAATEKRATGIGGPGESYGAWVTVGRFRCEVLRQGVQCVVVASGKGFLAERNAIVEVQTEPGIVEPAPQLGETVTLQSASHTGFAMVMQPGSKFAFPLNTGLRVSVGTLIDARRGAVRINAATVSGGVQTGVFGGGTFRVTQPVQRSQGQGKPGDLTVLSLAGDAQKECGGGLWGSAQGHFEIDGHYAAATAEAGKWKVEDGCAGTLVKAERGAASVEDFPSHRTVSLSAGQSYFAQLRWSGASHALIWRALNGKVVCGIVSHGSRSPASTLLCAARVIPPPPHTPNEEGDPGFAFLKRIGGAQPTRLSQYSFQIEDGWLPKNQVTLEAGQKWSYPQIGVSCTVAAARVRCANRSGHGFTITKRSYRGF
jgi:hypothetical protein